MATVHLTYLAFAAPAESRIEATVYQSHSMMTAGFHRHLGTASNPSGPRYALSALSRTNRPTTSFLIDDQLGDHLSRGRELSYLPWAEHIGFARTSLKHIGKMKIELIEETGDEGEAPAAS
jgi:hypothetical protein